MKLPITTLGFSLSLLLTSLGCKAKPAAPPKGASCAEVAANIARIGKGLNNQSEAVARCEAEKMPVQLRNCLAKAPDLDGLGACIPPSSVPKHVPPPITTGPGVVGAPAN
ncbi:MAG: hypothetical protein KBG15_09070 [Kofleriaceae bacterium]|nr:hypothetical protein [Kofleriaceae bacterium]